MRLYDEVGAATRIASRRGFAAPRAEMRIAESVARNSRRKTLGTAAKRMIKGNSGKIALGVAGGYAVGGVMRRHGRPVDRISGRPTGMYGF